ncbi:MAG: hypothetical protein ACI9GM_000420 [Salibacteraceae bacterium]|jgi:hypothetical protein
MEASFLLENQGAYKTLITQMGQGTKNKDEIKDEFNLFPIPTSAFLTLSFHLSKPQTISIKLIDLKGVNVKIGLNDVEYHGREGINEHSMDVSDIPNGVYFILLTTDEYVVKKRIIKLE